MEDSPPPTVSFLVTEGFYEAGTIRVDVIKAILGVSLAPRRWRYLGGGRSALHPHGVVAAVRGDAGKRLFANFAARAPERAGAAPHQTGFGHGDHRRRNAAD